VKTGRGARLKDDPTIFTGLYWLGEKSIPLGLADGYGTVDSVARELVKTDNIVDVTPSDDLVDRFTKRFGVMLSAALLSQGDSGPQLK
jgi:protease-4